MDRSSRSRRRSRRTGGATIHASVERRSIYSDVQVGDRKELADERFQAPDVAADGTGRTGNWRGGVDIWGDDSGSGRRPIGHVRQRHRADLSGEVPGLPSRGSIAPMSLVTYEDARPWAKAIKERVRTRQMPPWHIDKTVGIQQFKNDMSLSDDQIDTIVAWVDAGAPMGDRRTCRRRKPVASRQRMAGVASSFGQAGHRDQVRRRTRCRRIARTSGGAPLTTFRLTEPRWVRAVEMRPAELAGRKIIASRLAYLVAGTTRSDAPRHRSGSGGNRDDPDRPRHADGMGDRQELRHVRPDTGKLLLPGSKSGGTCTSTPSAKRFATTSNSASGFIRKARSRSTAPI